MHDDGNAERIVTERILATAIELQKFSDEKHHIPKREKERKREEKRKSKLLRSLEKDFIEQKVAVEIERRRGEEMLQQSLTRDKVQIDLEEVKKEYLKRNRSELQEEGRRYALA
eukprot:2117105-Karenia_brevis.AAC.1